MVYLPKRKKRMWKLMQSRLENIMKSKWMKATKQLTSTKIKKCIFEWEEYSTRIFTIFSPNPVTCPLNIIIIWNWYVFLTYLHYFTCWIRFLLVLYLFSWSQYFPILLFDLIDNLLVSCWYWPFECTWCHPFHTAILCWLCSCI